MPRKATQLPQKGELVLGTIGRVNPFSVQVMLDEYPGKDGSVHIGEVARKWIKDIRDFVKEGQKVVCLVLDSDESRGTVVLSLKRVDKRQETAKVKEVKREQRAEKMLETTARALGLNLDDAYKQVGYKLLSEFGELYKGFEHALTPAGREILLGRGVPKKWVDALAAVAEKEISPKEVELKFSLELQTPAPNGVEAIKKTLGEAKKKFGVSIKYVSAPKYSVSFKTKDAKAGERKLSEACEFSIKEIKASGGEGKFEKVS